jgi:segregation and condensation protein B
MESYEMAAPPPVEEAQPEQLVIEAEAPAQDTTEDHIKAMLEAVVYITDEPLTAAQIAAALGEDPKRIETLLEQLVEEYNRPAHGVTIREVAGGYKMTTKAEHHDAIRTFVKNLNPPLKLSLAALETLAVIAYKQPITAPEVLEIRGVQGAGVLKTLLDRKLITTAGRKNVIGRPILYKTTKDFMVQFGLKNLAELPSLKEFEELRRLALSDDQPAETAPETTPTEVAATEAVAETDSAPEPEAEQPEAQPEPEAEPQPAPEPEPQSEPESSQEAE